MTSYEWHRMNQSLSYTTIVMRSCHSVDATYGCLQTDCVGNLSLSSWRDAKFLYKLGLYCNMLTCGHVLHNPVLSHSEDLGPSTGPDKHYQQLEKNRKQKIQGEDSLAVTPKVHIRHFKC